MSCFSDGEREEAARTQQRCRERLAEIEREYATASPERHTQLSREAHTVFRDLQYATFVLTEDGDR